MSTDPTIARVEDYPHDHVDTFHLQKSRERAETALRADLPYLYADAVSDEPRAREWAREIVRAAVASGAHVPQFTPGPSIAFVGGIGTGKTHQAFGLLRAFAVSGLHARWEVATAADYYAALRPRSGVDHESEYQRFAEAHLLILDDVGAEKPSEWTEEQLYRLINHRYVHGRRTIITTNLTGPAVVERLGERIASRLRQMCHRVVLNSGDRRTAPGGTR